MEGAVRHNEPEPAPPGTPPPEVVHRIHDRFLVEVVEQLGLCPFARHSREQGRVHRPLVYADPPASAPAPAAVADRIRTLVVAHPDAEIVLVTFVSPHPAAPVAERARLRRLRPQRATRLRARR